MPAKILVIDDEPDVAAYIQAILEKNGYQTFTASNADQGWQTLQETQPDLITLDILMPEETGINFFRRVRKDPQLSNLPIVIVTGFTGPAYPMADLEVFLKRRRFVKPPDGFVRKPIDPEKLVQTIEQALNPVPATT